MTRFRRGQGWLIGALAAFALAGVGLVGCAHGIVTDGEMAGVGWPGDGGGLGWGWRSDAITNDVAAIRAGMAHEREAEAEAAIEATPNPPDAAVPASPTLPPAAKVVR